MRLTKYPDVKTIREKKTITLMNQDGVEVELEIQDLPPTYGSDVEAVLPTPKPTVSGPLKDSKGRIERDERTGKPILLYDDTDPDYLRTKSENQTLQLVLLVVAGAVDGQLEFDTPLVEGDEKAFYRGALEEMKAFGFGLGQVTRIAQAVKDLSGITDEDVARANADFTTGAN